jgi:hypothetical protein
MNFKDMNIDEIERMVESDMAAEFTIQGYDLMAIILKAKLDVINDFQSEIRASEKSSSKVMEYRISGSDWV